MTNAWDHDFRAIFDVKKNSAGVVLSANNLKNWVFCSEAKQWAVAAVNGNKEDDLFWTSQYSF